MIFQLKFLFICLFTLSTSFAAASLTTESAPPLTQAQVEELIRPLLRAAAKEPLAKHLPKKIDFGWKVGSYPLSIQSLAWQGPAANKGLLPGDRLLGVNGYRVDQLQDAEFDSFITSLCKKSPSLDLAIERNGSIFTCQVKGEVLLDVEIALAKQKGALRKNVLYIDPQLFKGESQSKIYREALSQIGDQLIQKRERTWAYFAQCSLAAAWIAPFQEKEELAFMQQMAKEKEQIINRSFSQPLQISLGLRPKFQSYPF